MPGKEDKIEVQNVNVPGRTTLVDRAMYEAMRTALWKVLPTQSPGLTQTEMREAILPHLPHDLYPDGAKSMWWAKTVQLDQEARGAMVREESKPLRWYRKK